MNLAIIDSNYNKRKYRGLAASWLAWELKRAGKKECPPEIADVLLCTVSSQQGVADLRRELKKYWNGRAKIVLGGGGCWGPAVFENMVDCICVGEGQRFVRTLLSDGYDAVLRLPETWVMDEAKTVVPSRSFPWDCPPLLHPDGTVRVWGSRGCKRKCLFCQTGWEQKYNPLPNETTAQRQISMLEKQKKRVAVITNDGAVENLRFNGQQEFLSVSFDQLKNMLIDRQKCKSIRIGVEGVGERLRKAVKKPVPNDGLCDVTFKALGNGVGVRWFFIAGLPFEADGDWTELKDLVMELHRLKKGVVMMNFHAFIPQPATPLCVFPLRDEYWERFQDFRKWFFHGPGLTRRVQIVACAQYPGRLNRARESMAATAGELRRGWFQADNKNWRVRYLLNPSKMRSLAEKYKAELVK